MDRMALPEYEGMRIVARQDELAPFQWMAFYEAVGEGRWSRHCMRLLRACRGWAT